MKLAIAVIGLVTGTVLGLASPVIVVVVGPGIYAGPTYLGLFFLLCALLALVLGIVALFTRGRDGVSVPSFVATGAVAVGILAGNVLSPVLGVGWRAGEYRPAPTWPALSFPPPAVVRQAQGAVTVRLDGAAAFSPRTVIDDTDTLFGHWCYSEGDGERVGEIAAIDVGRLGEGVLWADLYLIAPTGPYAPPMEVPRLRLELRLADGQVPQQWIGVGHVVTNDVRRGRVAFAGLQADAPGLTTWPATLSGELAWSCQPWNAQ